LATCDEPTRQLFGLHPGGKGAKFRKPSEGSSQKFSESSPNASGKSPTNARAHPREVASGYRLGANADGTQATVTDHALGDRAQDLLERYAELYTKHRHGAKLRLMHSNLDFQGALTLCRTWDDARLDKLAVIVLTTDEDWISGTDRSFKIFCQKASWADSRLAEHEAKRA
jgi:hypothetical protein